MYKSLLVRQKYVVKHKNRQFYLVVKYIVSIFAALFINYLQLKNNKTPCSTEWEKLLVKVLF